MLVRAAGAPIRAIRNRGTDHSKTSIWALSDVSFEIPQGEVVGIIGRNGAGKSTLLKILSRITARHLRPAVQICGRVAALLEVGTGLPPGADRPREHLPERRDPRDEPAEIQRKFDEIVDFAGVEQFLDTPVKRYSSGMYVRLAFAVAAHLEPEILIVDEVLAVGDAEFQRKCLGKMGEVAAGRPHRALRQPQHGHRADALQAQRLPAGRTGGRRRAGVVTSSTTTCSRWRRR